MISAHVGDAATNLRPGVEFTWDGDDSDTLVALENGVPAADQSVVPSEAEIITEVNSIVLSLARSSALEAIDTLRDIKMGLPIMTEGETVDVGTLSSGALANAIFAYDGKIMVVNSITRSGSTATFVFAKNHHLDTGQEFESAGADQAEYNGDFTVTVTGKKTLDVTVSGTPANGTGSMTALTKNFVWIDALNNVVFWSATKIKAIHRDATKYDQDSVQQARKLKDEVLSATTVAEIDAIDIEAGWPDTGV